MIFRYITEVNLELVCGKTTDVFISPAHYAEQWMYDTLIKQFWSQGDIQMHMQGSYDIIRLKKVNVS